MKEKCKKNNKRKTKAERSKENRSYSERVRAKELKVILKLRNHYSVY